MALKDLLKTGAAPTATPTIPKPSNGGGLKSLLISSAPKPKPVTPPKPVAPAGAVQIKNPNGNVTYQTPSGGTIEILPDGNKIATLPAHLGGGVYNIKTSNPGEVINTGHTDYAGEPQQKGKQRDDIVPVGLGGSNQSLGNIKATPLKSATKTDELEKELAQKVKSGKMSLGEARTKILTEKQKTTPDLLTKASDASENVLGAGAKVLGSIFDLFAKGAKIVEKGSRATVNTIADTALPPGGGMPFSKNPIKTFKEQYKQAPTIGQSTGELLRPLVKGAEQRVIDRAGGKNQPMPSTSTLKNFLPAMREILDPFIAASPEITQNVLDEIIVPAVVSAFLGSEISTKTLKGELTPDMARAKLANGEISSPEGQAIARGVIESNKSLKVDMSKPAGGLREFIGKWVLGGRPKTAANIELNAVGEPQGGKLPGGVPPTEPVSTPELGVPKGGAIVSTPAPMSTPPAVAAPAAASVLGKITATPTIQPKAPSPTPPAPTIQQPTISEPAKIKPPLTLEVVPPATQTPVQAFEASKGQKLIETHNGVKFELGSFGRNAAIRKGDKADRFNKNELAATIQNIKKVFKASDNPKSYRAENLAWVAEMANGEKRVIYTRRNKNGAEEILNWHRVDQTKNPNYLKQLESFGSPAGNRTRIAPLEPEKSNPLTHGTESSLSNGTKRVKYPKPTFDRNKLKTLLANNAEFKARPYLTVVEQDGKKLLSFKGNTSRFAIQAEALGLNPDGLSVGEKIFVDKKSLENKNDEIRVMQNAGSASTIKASRSDFASNTPVEEGSKPQEKSGLVFRQEGPTKGTFSETPIELGSMGSIKPLEMPEIVKLARELMQGFPSVAKLRGSLRGFFRPKGNGQIVLDAGIFKDPLQAAKTLAHELGHLVDYLPEHLMKRGNLIGRLFTLRNFLKETFNGEGSLDRAKILKQYLEEENITTTEWQKDKEIRTKHEPLFEEFYKEALKRGGYVKNEDIRNELITASKYWRPWDPAASSPSFNAYRLSSEELYADALSMILNSPGTLERMAPTFYKTFFDKLDQKPAVKEQYFGLQELLTGTPADLLKARQEDIRKGFARAEAVQKDFQAKKKLRIRSLWDRLRQQLDDINQPILNKQYQAEARGEFLPDEENPKFLLQENSLADNENFLMIKEIHDKVVVPLEKAGMTMDDLGEYLLLKRIQNERTDIANPFGHTPKTATQQLEHLKETLGDENYKLLETKLQQFHDEIFKSVEEAARVGSYNKKLFEEKIKPNKDTYASFAVVDYMQDYIPATVKAQVGTLKEVANPFNTTILKTVALNRLNALQRAKNGTIKLLQTSFPEDIAKSKTITSDGKLKIFKTPVDRGRIEVLEDGKLVGYDVDPYIAESFNKNKTGDLNVMVHLLSMFNNKFFKPVVTTYNLGFAAAFNPIRDLKRNYKLIPHATVRNLLMAYIKDIPAAVRYTKGELDALTREMVESKAIDAPIGEYNFYDRENDHYNDILKRYNIIPKDLPEGKLAQWSNKAKATILKPAVMVLEGIRFVANTLEINSKIAGYQLRKQGGESGRTLAHNVRNFTGTPNFRVRGVHTGTTNNIFVFSNILKEGFKSDFSIAANPKTRSGYWWKTVKIEFLPKFLMFLAAGGFLGKKLKDFYDKVTEYDKTNYIVIPLGYYGDEKKAVYLRIPHDETGRLFASVFWKMSNFAKNHKTSDLQDIVSLGAGQLPSVTPAIDVITNWAQYLSGRNPYDSFRGRQVVDDVSWQAGGGAALKKMVQWTLNDLGLSSFATYDRSSNTGLETFLQVAPWFRSLFKITDYGLQEKLKKEGTAAQQEAARLSLKRKDVVSQYAKDINDPSDLTLSKLHEIGKQIYGDAYKPNKQDAQLKNSLLEAAIKNDGDARVSSLISATTNKQKASILSKIKAGMDEQQYKDFTDRLVKFKVITRPLLLLVK